MKSLKTLSPYYLITLLLLAPALAAQPVQAASQQLQDLPQENFPEEEPWQKEPDPSEVFPEKLIPPTPEEEKDFLKLEVSTQPFETGMREGEPLCGAHLPCLVEGVGKGELDLGEEIIDESLLQREKKVSFPAEEEVGRVLGVADSKALVDTPKGWKASGKVQLSQEGESLERTETVVKIVSKDPWAFDLEQDLTVLRPAGPFKVARIAYLRVSEISADGKITAKVLEAFEVVEEGDWIEMGRK